MNTREFKIGYGILILFLIIYVGSLISWVFRPIIVIFQTLFIPFILSGFLYYLLRPFVRIINKKLPRGKSILLVYLILFCIIIGILFNIGPILQRQLYSLIDNMPDIISEIQKGFTNIEQSKIIQRFEFEGMMNIDGLILQLGTLINQVGINLASNIASFIGVLINALLVLIIAPFILFYILRDGERLGDYILSLFRSEHRDDVKLIFSDIDRTLSSYIQGQGIVCLCVGTLCYIAFLIIGLDYALLLAVVAGVTNIIPYVGPWIGTVPAVIVALFQSPVMALLTIIFVAVIQQVESSLIAPQVIGRKMQIHPITIMFLVLIAGRLVGIIGMILAVPTYAISKVLFIHGRRLLALRYREELEKELEQE
jgi:predicted PurR-regulated permease PerM